MSERVVKLEIQLNIPSNSICKRKRPVEISSVVLPSKKKCSNLCSDIMSLDYAYIVGPINKALQIFESLRVNGGLEEYDRRELQNIRYDAENVIKQIIENPASLLNEIMHRNRITLHNRLLAFGIKYNIPLHNIVLQAQVLWRLNFKLDILRVSRMLGVRCIELYPDLIVDRDIIKIIRTVDSEDGLKLIFDNVKFIAAMNLLSKYKELIRPRSDIPEKDTNDMVTSSASQVKLLNAIQNAREIVKQLLVHVWELHRLKKLTPEQTSKNMKLFDHVMESILNQDKMLSLFYLFPMTGELKQLGIPWAMKQMSDEYQFIINYIHDHKSFFSITPTMSNIIMNYFPHLVHHLMPCLPAHFNPQNTEKTQWKKMYFRVADLSWRMFWASNADKSLLNIEPANNTLTCNVSTVITTDPK